MFKDYTKYEVYPNGKIWSYSQKKWLKPWTRKDGYQTVCLYDNEGKAKKYLLHRVVYEAVTGEPIPNNLQINHRSEVKTENFFANLELMTPKQNANWGSRNERAAKAISKAMTNNTKISKAVGAFKDGKLVMVFPSTREAGRQGFNQGNISECCNGKLPHYRGYTWKYINEKET